MQSLSRAESPNQSDEADYQDMSARRQHAYQSPEVRKPRASDLRANPSLQLQEAKTETRPPKKIGLESGIPLHPGTAKKKLMSPKNIAQKKHNVSNLEEDKYDDIQLDLPSKIHHGIQSLDTSLVHDKSIVKQAPAKKNTSKSTIRLNDKTGKKQFDFANKAAQGNAA